MNASCDASDVNAPHDALDLSEHVPDGHRKTSAASHHRRTTGEATQAAPSKTSRPIRDLCLSKHAPNTRRNGFASSRTNAETSHPVEEDFILIQGALRKKNLALIFLVGFWVLKVCPSVGHAAGDAAL